MVVLEPRELHTVYGDCTGGDGEHDDSGRILGQPICAGGGETAAHMFICACLKPFCQRTRSKSERPPAVTVVDKPRHSRSSGGHFTGHEAIVGDAPMARDRDYLDCCLAYFTVLVPVP